AGALGDDQATHVASSGGGPGDDQGATSVLGNQGQQSTPPTAQYGQQCGYPPTAGYEPTQQADQDPYASLYGDTRGQADPAAQQRQAEQYRRQQEQERLRRQEEQRRSQEAERVHRERARAEQEAAHAHDG